MNQKEKEEQEEKQEQEQEEKQEEEQEEKEHTVLKHFKMNGSILIIDDEPQLRKLLFRLISLEGFEVQQAADLKSAISILKHHTIQVVLCDVKLPDGNGIDFVQVVKKNYPGCETILLTAFGNISDGVNAMKNGAFDYILKGEENSRIIPLLHQAVAKVRRLSEGAVKISEKTSNDFSTITGKSDAIQTALAQAQKIAVTEVTVLLLGETGTGKEVFANAIHHHSKRNGKAFVAINCSAFSRDLLEGELFGHKAGSFTGATRDKQGLVEVADGGTLFLDEVGELPLEFQAKLLRFLENGEFIKVGDTRMSTVSVRLIAATNRNLKAEIEKGQFREDLYYRLNVFSISLPPLRERTEDIEVLANGFIRQFSILEGRPQLKLNREAVGLLKNYNWKGNIRELKNVIQRALILAEGDEILGSNLPFEIQSFSGEPSNAYTLSSVEKQHILRMLEYTRGNKTRTAELLDIGLATLYRKIDEYKIGTGQPK